MVTPEAALGLIRAAGLFVLVMSVIGVVLEWLKGSR